MVLAAFNGHPVIICCSLRDVEGITRLLVDKGYSVRIKIIKAKPRRHKRHFLVFPYRASASAE